MNDPIDKAAIDVSRQEAGYLLSRLIYSIIYWILTILVCIGAGLFVVEGIVFTLQPLTHEALPRSKDEVYLFVYYLLKYPGWLTLLSVAIVYISFTITTGISNYMHQFETKRPTFAILACKYCGFDLDTSLNLICNNCKRIAPLGYDVLFYRILGKILTITHVLVTAIIIAVFFFIFYVR